VEVVDIEGDREGGFGVDNADAEEEEGRAAEFVWTLFLSACKVKWQSRNARCKPSYR